MSAEETILRELSRLSGQIRTQQKSGKLWISCPLGTHSDSKPSFGINLTAEQRPVGTWYCFGCGKGGSWNGLAQILGLAKIRVSKDGSVDRWNTKGDTRASNVMRYQPPATYSSVDEMARENWRKLQPLPGFPEPVWRGIEVQVLDRIGAQCYFDPIARSHVVVLPVWVGRELVGGIKALWEKSDNPDEQSYITTGGPWVKETGLFGFDDCKAGEPFVLVEGPRDRLRLLQEGIPSMAILGALQWDTAKSNLVASKNPRKVLCFFDGDAAGDTALDLVMSSLDAIGVASDFVDAVDLTARAAMVAGYDTQDEDWDLALKKHKVDPANCSVETLDRIRRWMAK